MTHQFIKVAEIDRALSFSVDMGGASRRIPGAIVVCAECGEARHIYADGVMEITIRSKTPCQNQKQ